MNHQSFKTASYIFINYAEMTAEDSNCIRLIRNSPIVRKWMVDSSPISSVTHDAFVESLKARVDKDYFIIKNHSGEIIGSVNIDYREDGVSERGLFINPVFQKQGYAFKTMQEFYRHAKDDWCIEKIMTKVKIDNAASNGLELKLGANFGGEINGYNHYVLRLL